MLLLAVFLLNHLLLMLVEGHVVDLIVHHHRHQIAHHVIMATLSIAQIHADLVLCTKMTIRSTDPILQDYLDHHQHLETCHPDPCHTLAICTPGNQAVSCVCRFA